MLVLRSRILGESSPNADSYMVSELDSYMVSKLLEIPTIVVKKMHDGIFIPQEKYANQILERFKMLNNKVAPTPAVVGLKLSKEYCSKSVNPTLYKSIVGSLMY